LGNIRGGTECLEGLAEEASAQKQPERAARLFGAAEVLREAGGWPFQEVYRADYEPHVAATRAALGARAFAAAWAKGRATPRDQAYADALAGRTCRSTPAG
jgi:hypothetical protein